VVFLKPGAPGAYWRDAEVRGLSSLVQAAQAKAPGGLIAVLGNFNSAPGDPPPSIFTQPVGGATTEPKGLPLLNLFQSHPASDPQQAATAPRCMPDTILMNTQLAHAACPRARFILGVPVKPSDRTPGPRPSSRNPAHYPVVVDFLIPAGR
jgi:hypothetical protein